MNHQLSNAGYWHNPTSSGFGSPQGFQNQQWSSWNHTYVSNNVAANINSHSAIVDDFLEETYENYMDAIDKEQKRKIKRNDLFQKYIVLMSSYLIFPREVAAYFSLTELVQHYLGELGVNDEGAMLFLFIMHGVNFPALKDGKFQLNDGYLTNWLIDIYDYVLSKLKVEDYFRLGSQMLFPQSAKPEYNDR